MKIRFKSNDDLPLNKPIKLCILTIFIRSVFSEDRKFYSQLFLDDVSERIDVNKRSASKKCELCYYWFFKKYWI